MDEVVWTEVIRLLEDPALIQQELDRRLAAAQAADPTKKRTQAVERDLARVGKSIERLLTAYQEDLLSLGQLRERMPQLRQREQTLRHELNALVEQTRERAAHLRLAETLSAFSRACARRPRRSTSWNSNESCASSSRRSSSMTTRS